ncbi:hypothetical protein GW932_01460 [archaeon]|nr:hypothetical protein [archaeon]
MKKLILILFFGFILISTRGQTIISVNLDQLAKDTKLAKASFHFTSNKACFSYYFDLKDGKITDILKQEVNSEIKLFEGKLLESDILIFYEYCHKGKLYSGVIRKEVISNYEHVFELSLKKRNLKIDHWYFQLKN